VGLAIILVSLNVLFTDKKEKTIYDKISVDKTLAAIKKERDESIEVLFFGDSVCYSSFSPKVLWEEYGITSFILGTSAQRLCDTYTMLNETLNTQKPAVVVLEATCLYRKPKTEIDDTDIVLKYINDKTSIVQNHSDWKYFIDRRASGMAKPKEDYNRGFVERNTINPYNGGDYMVYEEGMEAFPGTNEEYLGKLCELCKEKGIAFVLVSSPSPSNWNYKRHNKVSQWAEENGVKYYDFNLDSGVGIDWSVDTKDGGDHLNITGSKKVSSYLGAILADEYKVENLSEKEEYQSWFYNK